jgi:hypothetical protein
MPATRPFVDRPMTDAELADRAAAAAAAAWALPPPTVLRRGMNALYTSGGVVLRVGWATADPVLAHELAQRLASHGIATAMPYVGAVGWFEDVAVSGWEHLEHSGQPIDWTSLGRAVRCLHSLDVGIVPEGYPVPDPAGFPWWDFDHLLADVAAQLDPAAAAGLAAAVERHRGWEAATQRSPVLCHGDVHPGNVVMTVDGPKLLDWDLLCRADPAWDHAMLTTLASRWGGPVGAYTAFASGYGVSLADDPLTRSLAELRNVAATLMRARAARHDPSARVELERRLRYWRGEPDAPPWQAQ